MKLRGIGAFLLIAVMLVMTVGQAASVSGAAFTTFNAHVDGAGKDVCKNSAINCNIYGDKEYVWLNGGPTANGLGPDGDYFFAVLEPGGQPNPNDQGAVADKNLSDDYDCYQNRIFTVTDGEVSAYAGNYDCTSEGYTEYTPFRHWLDDGDKGSKPNWEPPYIRLYPYSDTTNPGGVYILAICSLDEGYPVDPRDCKYDAFKVKKGKLPYQFMLSGTKFQDTYADGVKDSSDVDPGLTGWQICITGTGPDGNLIDNNCETMTGTGGYWEWYSPDYEFHGKDEPVAVHLEICEELQDGWTQSYPDTEDGCYTLDFIPEVPAFDSFGPYDFGNWEPVSVTACKMYDADGDESTDDDQEPVAGWPVALTVEGDVVDEQVTEDDGCYTWSDLTPHAGEYYDVHEGSWTGWVPLGDTGYVFPADSASSGNSLGPHTFVNTYFEGCTPGFWQGGPDKPDAKAGGALLWDGDDTLPWEGPFLPPPHVDAQWTASGGQDGNPYIHITDFDGFFGGTASGGLAMFELVDTGGGPENWRKAARSLVAAYLNASWGMNYPYSTDQLAGFWADAVADGSDAAFLALHTKLDAANNSQVDIDGDGETEHLCPISAGGW